jgi:zinc resistance-associated protein
MKRNIKGIMVAAVLAIFGLSTLAFAGWGTGYDGHMGMGRGGWGHMGGQGDYGQSYGNLTSDQQNQINQLRDEFFRETENLRQTLDTKGLELRNELAKENLDETKVSKLQADISSARSELDQKSLSFEVKARKAVPDYNRASGGYGHMMGRGNGGGYGNMMGSGYGAGNCGW